MNNQLLSKMDLRLISALEENGRASYAQLARLLDINLSTASKRVDALMREEVLTIQAVPNPYKIGHTAAALICMNISADRIDAVCAGLRSIFNVIMIATTFGRFNVVIAVYFRTWEELHLFISRELSGKAGIYEIEIFFVKDIRKPYDANLQNTYTERSTIEIDEIDQKIIETLTKNGRYSGINIARSLGVSPSSVSKRLARLFDENIIQVIALINPARLGFHSNVFILLRVEPGRIDEICSSLRPHQEVITIMSLINGYDIYVSTLARDARALYEFIKKKMTRSSGVISLETLICGDIIKRYYSTYRIADLVME